MIYTIYKTTNIVNGKFYIGKHQTKDLNDGYLGSGKLLKRAITKYGVDNFHKEILLICKDEAHMNLLESILVVPDPEINYNLCEGGKGGFGYINSTIYTEDKRKSHNKKISKSGMKSLRNKNIELLSSWAAKGGSKSKGKTLSSSTVEKISKSCSNLIWITNGSNNRKIKKSDTIPNEWYRGRTI